MPRLHLVRHGRAAAGWGEDSDPGLSEQGVRQAEVVADALAAELDPVPLVSSPLRRAVETADPLASRWAAGVQIEAAYGEIPSPTPDLAQRQAWLSAALASTWDDLDEDVQRWRRHLLGMVRSTQRDQIVFTHFVAINALVAEATADSAVTVFLPANTSVTVLDVDPAAGTLRVVRLGSEATPEVG